MTFSELVAEIEKRHKEEDYDVSVEMEQRKNYQCCEHSKKTKRVLSWRFYQNGKSHTAETAEGLLAKIDPPPSEEANLATVDAETTL